MIIACPRCKASFLVLASLFEGGPRTVRCARCGHVWLADPHKKKPHKEEIFIPEAPKAPEWPASQPSTPPPPAKPAEPPKPSRLQKGIQKTKETLAQVVWRRVLKWSLILSGACVTAAVLFLILGKETVIYYWPETQIYYKMAGLIAPPEPEKLALENIRSERRYMDGAMHLVVAGDIRSQAEKTQILPAILVEAIGPDNQLIQSWHIDPPQATLPPGQKVPFSSAIISPEGTVVEVNLSFVEPPHDQP